MKLKQNEVQEATNLRGGIVLVDKPKGVSSFYLVKVLRKITNIKKVGHAGTLDPFATGLLVLLVGKNFTRLSDKFLTSDKEYEATLKLGVATDSFDETGEITKQSDTIPEEEDIKNLLPSFCGKIQQTPPMFSAKKVNGKKLYELARKGIEIERKSVEVDVEITFLSYSYPELKIYVKCSKGTYIRSLANDIGETLGCFAHLTDLRRTKSGEFLLSDSFSLEQIQNGDFGYLPIEKM